MKPKNAYHEIWNKEIKKRTPIYILGVFFQAITQILNLVAPIIIGNILDLLLKNAPKEEIFYQSFLLIIIGIVWLFPRILYRICYFTNARISDTKLREEVIRHLQEVKPEYYEKEEKGTFLAYLSHELLFFARKSFGNLYFYFSDIVIAPILTVIVVANTINPIIAISAIPLILIAIIYIVIQYKKLNQKLENSREVYIELSKMIEQNTSCFSLIKLYNQQHNQKQTFKNVNQNTKIADYEIGVIKNKTMNGMNILFASTHIVGFGLGLLLAYFKMMTLGELTAYLSCLEFTLGCVISGLPKFLTGLGYYKQTRNRYNYFYYLDTYGDIGKDLTQINQIDLTNLTYSYDGKVDVLKNINMTIKRGEKIGIIGQVGSGKTTLMNIIAGFYELPDGMIKINGIDKNEYKPDDIFHSIGYAMQKNIILDENVENNVTINSKLDEEKFENVIKNVELAKDIEQMNDGIKTELREEGSRLSGGQKQRISVARNLYHLRQVNIFDDTLSALDQETEDKVLKNILEVGKDETIIVVSNRASHMEQLDRVYILANGTIEDVGTHQELLERNSTYQEFASFEKEGELV